MFLDFCLISLFCPSVYLFLTLLLLCYSIPLLHPFPLLSTLLSSFSFSLSHLSLFPCLLYFPSSSCPLFYGSVIFFLFLSLPVPFPSGFDLSLSCNFYCSNSITTIAPLFSITFCLLSFLTFHFLCLFPYSFPFEFLLIH